MKVKPFFISCFINFRISKGVPVGHFLSGTVTFAKDVIGKKVVSLMLL
jgi:hypothetical protein